MKKLIYILVFLFSLNGVFAQAYKMPADTEFFYLYGGVNPDVARSIKELPGGGYIIAGTSSSFGQGDASVYLIKTDSMGKHLWSAPYGGSQNDWGYSVEVTADSGYFVAGYSNSFNPPNGYDAYYFKTDKFGALQWQKTISGSDWDFIYGSVAMPDGGFILCGETFTDSKGGTDAYLVRLNKSGDTLWTKRYGGLYDETFNSVTIMNNQIYAVGKNATHATDTVADGWIVRLDTNGLVLKEAFVTDPHAHFEEVLLGITPYTNSFFNFCGKTNQLDSNSVTSILGRADTALNFSWVFSDGPTPPGQVEVYTDVINISYGNICVMGYKNGGHGGPGMFFAGFNNGGGFINDFAHNSGGEYDDYGYDGIYTKKGRIIAVGSTQGSDIYFCKSQGAEDAFLVRFNGDSLLNNTISNKNPKSNCFKDTLFLWEPSINKNNSDISLKLYPNPTESVSQLEIKTEINNIYSAKIYSILGDELFTSKVTSNTTNKLDLSILSNGSYFLKLQDNNGVNQSVIKFVIAK